MLKNNTGRNMIKYIFNNQISIYYMYIYALTKVVSIYKSCPSSPRHYLQFPFSPHVHYNVHTFLIFVYD
jgi:hypothetical protein